MDKNAMRALTYGLFVLTAKGAKDNGCIINTAMQVTTSPNRISITVSKENYTHDIIRDTGVFNLSILDETTPFAIFEHFGFASGRNTDKFVGDTMPRSANGLIYLPVYTTAFISGKVFQQIDLGTHTMFLADVTDGEVLDKTNSISYAYYHANVKPKPAAKEEKKAGWVCRICGYVYEGAQLPPDYICPLCKHGADDFEPIGG